MAQLHRLHPVLAWAMVVAADLSTHGCAELFECCAVDPWKVWSFVLAELAEYTVRQPLAMATKACKLTVSYAISGPCCRAE